MPSSTLRVKAFWHKVTGRPVMSDEEEQGTKHYLDIHEGIEPAANEGAVPSNSPESIAFHGGDHPSSSTVQIPAASSLPDQSEDVPLTPVNKEHVKLNTDASDTVTVESTTGALSQLQTSNDPEQPSDLWSKAYQEALLSLGEDVDVAILAGKNVEMLFTQLEELGKSAQGKSTLLRGVHYLQSLQVPLEKIKFLVDVASPLGAVHPAASTALGVVKSVTTIAVSLATADLEFAKQIGQMLEQLPYIDECDTLGQKTEKKDIFKALVSVYRKLLEFYKAAYDVLTKKGAKLVVGMVLANARLPAIVEEFLAQVELLRKLVSKAATEITAEIQVMLRDQEVSQWLDREQRTAQDEYHANLSNTRAHQACEMVLSNEQFIQWLDSPDMQSLALVGDTGIGKSYAMSSIVDELNKRNKSNLIKHKTCYYYCRNDESGQSRSIFMGLILPLLFQLEGLKKSFVEWYKEHQHNGTFNPTANVIQLQEYLEDTVPTLDRTLFFIIDGLDECDPFSQRTVLSFLFKLSRSYSKLKLLVASRPEKNILAQLGETPVMRLGAHYDRDKAIVDKMIEIHLWQFSDQDKAFLSEKLALMAQGNGIWVRMAVEDIRARKITVEEGLAEHLENLPQPSKLSELYLRIFNKYTESNKENQDIARLALKLLAAARRPLGLLELAWAVALGLAPSTVTTIKGFERRVGCQRLLSLIQPFLVDVDFEDQKKHQLQLVHQSVKEFIIEKWTPNSKIVENASNSIDGTADHIRIDKLEKSMLDVCMRYLLLDDIGSNNLFSDTQMALSQLPPEADLFSDESISVNQSLLDRQNLSEPIRYDPATRGFGQFFVYAARYWVDHFRCSTFDTPADLADLEKLCAAKTRRLDNWVQQYYRPGCTIYTCLELELILDKHDPLSVTCMHGSEASLQLMLEHGNFTSGQYFPDSAFKAVDLINLWPSLSALRCLFLELKFRNQLRTPDFFRALMKQWISRYTSRHNWDEAFPLMDEAVDDMIDRQWGNELLCVAIRYQCMPVILRLLGLANTFPRLMTELMRAPQRKNLGKYIVELGRGHQSIAEAAIAKNEEILTLPLQQRGIESHLQHRNLIGETVLHIACDYCEPTIMSAILARFDGSLNDLDHCHNTPLSRAINSTGSEAKKDAVIKMLLDRGGMTGSPINK